MLAFFFLLLQVMHVVLADDDHLSCYFPPNVKKNDPTAFCYYPHTNIEYFDDNKLKCHAMKLGWMFTAACSNCQDMYKYLKIIKEDTLALHFSHGDLNTKPFGLEPCVLSARDNEHLQLHRATDEQAVKSTARDHVMPKCDVEFGWVYGSFFCRCKQCTEAIMMHDMQNFYKIMQDEVILRMPRKPTTTPTTTTSTTSTTTTTTTPTTTITTTTTPTTTTKALTTKKKTTAKPAKKHETKKPPIVRAKTTASFTTMKNVTSLTFLPTLPPHSANNTDEHLQELLLKLDASKNRRYKAIRIMNEQMLNTLGNGLFYVLVATFVLLVLALLVNLCIGKPQEAAEKKRVITIAEGSV